LSKILKDSNKNIVNIIHEQKNPSSAFTNFPTVSAQINNKQFEGKKALALLQNVDRVFFDTLDGARAFVLLHLCVSYQN